MGNVRINPPTADTVSKPIIADAPYTESITFELNPNAIGTPNVTVVPSFTMKSGDYVAVRCTITSSQGFAIGGGRISYGVTSSVNTFYYQYGVGPVTVQTMISVTVNSAGITVSAGSFANSKATIDMTIFKASSS